MLQIPGHKRYFRIGEASRIIGVEPYVLRYWEGEFPQLRPRRADSNQRTYQRKDLETLFKIKELLYVEKMTIEGAKRRLARDAAGPERSEEPIIRELKDELKAILHMLS
jgi:DNA-binding transcriptional MerR regulator